MAARAGGGRCLGTARSTGVRCRITFGLDALGFCRFHSPRRPACRGLRVDGGRCDAAPKPGYGFCCAAHDPAVAYYAPSLFGGDAALRGRMEAQVVRRFDGRDAYHGDALGDFGALEMDHIVEKQCFAHTFQAVHFEETERGEDARWLAAVVRDAAVDRLDNLCLTRKPTNRIKGAAVWRFLDDSITGHRNAATFTNYMLGEEYCQDGSRTRVGRDTTRAISATMGDAIKWCRHTLADEGDTPMLDVVSDQLQRLYVDMELHTSTEDPVGYGGQRHRTVTRDVDASLAAKMKADVDETDLEPEPEPLKASTTLPAQSAAEPSGSGDFTLEGSSVSVISTAANIEQTNPAGNLTERKLSIVSATRAEVKGVEKASTDVDEGPTTSGSSLDSAPCKLTMHESKLTSSCGSRVPRHQLPSMGDDSCPNQQYPNRADNANEIICASNGDNHASSGDNRALPRSSDESSAAQLPVLETCVSVPARQEILCLHQDTNHEEDANRSQDPDHGQDETDCQVGVGCW